MRTCGSCQACCFAPAIRELNKPAHKPCAHQCSAGCAIYTAPERPSVCRTFNCLWLQSQGGIPDDERPDKFGVILETHRDESGGFMLVRELRKGAALQPKVQARIARALLLVRIKVEKFRRPASVSPAQRPVT